MPALECARQRVVGADVNVDIPVFEFADEPAVASALRRAADRVIASKWFVLGNEVRAFEEEFAAYCDSSECVGVANGTDALELSLRGIGISRGDRVATVANAGYYTSTALTAIGAEPVYIDIDENSLTMSPVDLVRQIDAVRAVVVTHLFGRLAAIEDIVALAGTRAVPVIEDCAQSHGAIRAGRRAGTFGVAGCFSFYPTKNLGALGDGGAIITSDPTLATKLRSLRQYGWDRKYSVTLSGGRNSRLDELQAAFLREKLPWLDIWNTRRRAIAVQYRDGLADLPLAIPQWVDEEYVAHLFVVQVEKRDNFRSHLAVAGIGTDVHYPIPDYRQQTVVNRSGFAPLPATELACRRVTTLPCFPGLKPEGVGRVITAVRQYYKRTSQH